MIIYYKEYLPGISEKAFIIGESFIAGNVEINDYVSIWPGVSARGDVNRIIIGQNTNIQDNSVLHCDRDRPLVIGKNVTVGHGAVLHGATIGNNVLIGIGAIILSGSIIEDNVIIGAGSVVPERKIIKSNYLYIGSPAKPMRELRPEEIEGINESAMHYIEIARNYPGAI